METDCTYRRACVLCGELLPQEPLLVCENMPAQAQNLPNEETLHLDHKKTLPLVQCPCCGLVQFVTEPVYYYKDVIRSGDISSTMYRLRQQQYAHFIELCHLEGKAIIEVGCGQGEFLSIWNEFPVFAHGIEHNEELVKKAVAKGLSVEVGFADKKDFPDGMYDAFCSFNFLEHQPDPRGMLCAIHQHLREEAYGLITVPSFEYILEKESYYELIPDHIAYYTENTLVRLVELCGFSVVEVGIVNRDTLSIIVKTRKNTDIHMLAKNREMLGNAIKTLVSGIKSKGKTLAVWGASHQGFTLLSTTGIGEYVDYIIDSAPFKQGHYAPGSHIMIVSPEYYRQKPVDNILIIAPGYTDEIVEIVRKKLMHTGIIYALRSNVLEKLSKEM